MNKVWDELKVKALNTEYPRWRRILSTIMLVVFSVTPVVVLWYLYLASPNTHCVKGFVYFLAPWLIAQLIMIIHLYVSTELSAIVRVSQIMVIGFANMWLILFSFTIETCS
jgi:hypothetical protein